MIFLGSLSLRSEPRVAEATDSCRASLCWTGEGARPYTSIAARRIQVVAAPSQTKLIVLNLKAGMPTVEQAKRRLLESLYAPRGASGPVVKIIHGYGSSGKGGAIRSAIREQMAEWQRAGKVLTVVPGENWSIFDPASQDLRQRYAFLGKDEDLDRGNAGMTLVEFPSDTSRIFR